MPLNMRFRFSPTKDGLVKVLGPLETEIMQIIWQDERSTVKKVHRKLSQHRDIAYTTVMNTMTRLAKKGVLESIREDQAYLYRPRQSRETFIHGVVGHVLERLLVQFTGPTQAVLNDYAGRYPDGHEKITGLLDEISRRRSAGNPSLHEEQQS